MIGLNNEGLTQEEVVRLEELDEKDTDELSDGELTAKVKLSIKRRYSSPEWATFFELTGKNGRRADAIAFNTYPSRNFKIVGFEFKVSRNDWLKEKKDGEKADFFVGQCDEWYVVAGKPGIVKESELPEGWGLIVMKGKDRLYKEVESNLTEYQDRPPSREFFVRAIKKSFDENFDDSDIREAKRRGYQEGRQRANNNFENFELQRMKDKAERFDKLADHGLTLWDVDQKTIKQIKRGMSVVKKIHEDGYYGIEGDLDNLERQAAHFQDSIEEVKSELHELREEASEPGVLEPFQRFGDTDRNAADGDET